MSNIFSSKMLDIFVNLVVLILLKDKDLSAAFLEAHFQHLLWEEENQLHILAVGEY